MRSWLGVSPRPHQLAESLPDPLLRLQTHDLAGGVNHLRHEQSLQGLSLHLRREATDALAQFAEHVDHLVEIAGAAQHALRSEELKLRVVLHLAKARIVLGVTICVDLAGGAPCFQLHAHLIDGDELVAHARDRSLRLGALGVAVLLGDDAPQRLARGWWEAHAAQLLQQLRFDL